MHGPTHILTAACVHTLYCLCVCVHVYVCVCPQDHVQQPFHDLLPYPAFSIRVSHDDVPQLQDILRCVCVCVCVVCVCVCVCVWFSPKLLCMTRLAACKPLRYCRRQAFQRVCVCVCATQACTSAHQGRHASQHGPIPPSLPLVCGWTGIQHDNTLACKETT